MKYTAPLLFLVLSLLFIFSMLFTCLEQDTSEYSESAAPPGATIESEELSLDTAAMALPADIEEKLLEKATEAADQSIEKKMPKSAPKSSSAPKSAPVKPSSKDIDGLLEKGEVMFHKSGWVGIPLSKRDAAKKCTGISQSNFKVILQPKSDTDLLSFVVYTNNCGGMNMSISGPAVSESAKLPLVKGKNLISLEGLDVRLRGGGTYILSCTGVAGCGSSQPPKFEHIGKCAEVASANHPNLFMDQKKEAHVYDLKFLFQ